MSFIRPATSGSFTFAAEEERYLLGTKFYFYIRKNSPIQMNSPNILQVSPGSVTVIPHHAPQ